MARYNYWGWPVYDNEFHPVYGATIDHLNPLQTNPNNLLKNSSSENNTAVNQDSFFDSELLKALQYQIENKNDEAILLYKQIFKKCVEIEKEKYVLNMIMECSWKENKKNDFIEYLNKSIRPNLSEKDELYPTILELENHWLFDNGKYEDVVANLIRIKTTFSENSDILKYTLFNLGCVYFNSFNDITMAKQYFTELEVKFPNDLLVLDSKLLMGETGGLPNAKYLGGSVKEENANTNSTVNQLPTEYALIGNFPNPFNPTTTIKYTLPTDGRVTIKVYDMLGREIKTLVNDYKATGNYSTIWDSKDSFGNDVSSGIYFYNIKFMDNSITKKMVLVR